MSHSILGALNFLSTIKLFDRDFYEILFVLLHIAAAIIVLESLKNYLNLNKLTKKIIYISAAVFIGTHIFNNFHQKTLDKSFDKKMISIGQDFIESDFKNNKQNKVQYLLKNIDPKDSSKFQFVQNKNNIKFIKSTAGDEKTRTYRSSEKSNYIGLKISKDNKEFHEAGFLYSDYRIYIDKINSIIAFFLLMLTFVAIASIIYYTKKE